MKCKYYYLCGSTAPPEVHFYRRSVGHVDGLSQREEDREPDKVWSWIYNYWWQDLRNLLSACKDQVASYQLNMFGVAVFGSIPRWTSLYRTESKYPANPAKMMGTTAVTKGIATVAVVKSNIHIYAYRAQGMIPYLVAFQIATWYTFDCLHLVRNLDVWK